MYRYHIRYNTKHGDSNLVWRIFEDGIESLAENIKIYTPVFSESTVENGIVKWNIACDGQLRWEGKTAIIIKEDI